MMFSLVWLRLFVSRVMCIKNIFESWERFGVTRAVQSISFCFRWGINASYKKLRRERGITQKGLAKAIAKSYVTIQSWEQEASIVYRRMRECC